MPALTRRRSQLPDVRLIEFGDVAANNRLGRTYVYGIDSGKLPSGVALDDAEVLAETPATNLDKFLGQQSSGQGALASAGRPIPLPKRRRVFISYWC